MEYDGQPELLALDGDDVDDLIKAVREDMENLQGEIDQYLAGLAHQEAAASPAA